MGDWSTARIGEVAECLDAMRKPVRAADRSDGPYPYYGASGVIDHVDHYLFDGTFALVAEDGENLRSRSTPVSFLARGKFWVNNHAHILSGSERCDVRFLSYAIENSDISGYLTGSTQPKLTQQSLLSMRLDWPPPAEQRAIADVLAALDDKIEANRRLALRCGELAVTLASLHPPKLALNALAHHLHDMVSPSVFGHSDVEHFSLPAFDSGGLPVREAGSGIKSGKFTLAGPAVLVSKLNPHIPRVWLAQPEGTWPAVTSTEFVVLSSKDGCPVELLWAICRSPQFSTDLLKMVKGTTGSHQRVTPGDVLRIEVQDPQDFSDAERDVIVTAAQLSQSMRRESAKLTATRDALLPKLLGGELRVNGVDSEILTETYA